MIELTGINKKEFLLNADHIEKIESVPETLITLGNGKKYMVLEEKHEIREKIIQYKRKFYACSVGGI